MSAKVWIVASSLALIGGEGVEIFDSIEAAMSAAREYSAEFAGDKWMVFECVGHYSTSKPRWKAAVR